jgi:hypothetical protein
MALWMFMDFSPIPASGSGAMGMATGFHPVAIPIAPHLIF